MDQLTSGALAMGFAVAGMFFLRFRRDTGDRLFALFAAAFFLMAVSRLVVAVSDQSPVREELYLIRLGSFVLILVAILDKNRKRRAPTHSPTRDV